MSRLAQTDRVVRVCCWRSATSVLWIIAGGIPSDSDENDVRVNGRLKVQELKRAGRVFWLCSQALCQPRRAEVEDRGLCDVITSLPFAPDEHSIQLLCATLLRSIPGMGSSHARFGLDNGPHRQRHGSNCAIAIELLSSTQLQY